jgi:hypothetical protein
MKIATSATDPRIGFMPPHLLSAALPPTPGSHGGDITRPSGLVLLATQLARRVAAARGQRALPWHADESASRGL